MPADSVSPVASVAEALDRWRAGERVEVLRGGVSRVLASVPDPRDPRGRRYSLAALLAIAILATAAGMRGYAGFAHLGAHGTGGSAGAVGDSVPSPEREDVPDGAVAAGRRRSGPPAGRLLHCASRAAEPAGLLAVALDGKTLRGALRAGARPPHLVSVFAHRARLVLGQLAVAEKSNEIPCVRKLLRLCRAGAAAGHGGRDAHAGRDRETDLRDSEIALPDPTWLTFGVLA